MEKNEAMELSDFTIGFLEGERERKLARIQNRKEHTEKENERQKNIVALFDRSIEILEENPWFEEWLGIIRQLQAIKRIDGG